MIHAHGVANGPCNSHVKSWCANQRGRRSRSRDGEQGAAWRLRPGPIYRHPAPFLHRLQAWPSHRMTMYVCHITTAIQLLAESSDSSESQPECSRMISVFTFQGPPLVPPFIREIKALPFKYVRMTELQKKGHITAENFKQFDLQARGLILAKMLRVFSRDDAFFC